VSQLAAFTAGLIQKRWTNDCAIGARGGFHEMRRVHGFRFLRIKAHLAKGGLGLGCLALVLMLVHLIRCVAAIMLVKQKSNSIFLFICLI
jgi:hypothetical protein